MEELLVRLSHNVARHLSLLSGLSGFVFLAACTTHGPEATPGPACVDCVDEDPTEPVSDGGSSGDSAPTEPPRSDDGIKNGKETDIDCGGPDAPTCDEGKNCLVDTDCHGACNYAKKCVDIPSCKPRFGGDTCGKGEVGQPGAVHESCCRTLPVKGFADPAHPGKEVYLDKYEITAGRVRAFLADIAAKSNGTPNVRQWIAQNTPPAWNDAWNRFIPADADGETILVDRNLLGDPRGTWPDAPPVPPEDEPRRTGTDFQFNGSLFVYIHGNNCSTHAPTAFGFPTWFYPANVLAKMGPEYPPRADGRDFAGAIVPASEHLDTKSMNCITNALLQAFCHWDGGQLATGDVLDFVTASPPDLGSKPGCGTQVGTENPPETTAATKGGRCADLDLINATYDAGASLPEPDHPLNENHYMFPFFPQGTMHDKAWQIAAPGRGTKAANGEAVDQVRIAAGDEPWMDLAGNLNEMVLVMDGAAFTGRFGVKYRGIGYQSARSQLNLDDKWDELGIARIERPEAKAGFAGGRCMRFR
jgi:hypothetical protein